MPNLPAPDSNMVLLNAFQAFGALLNLLCLPAVLMLALGILNWRRGNQFQSESRERLGKLLTAFGAILLTIVGVILYFMSFSR